MRRRSTGATCGSSSVTPAAITGTGYRCAACMPSIGGKTASTGVSSSTTIAEAMAAPNHGYSPSRTMDPCPGRCRYRNSRIHKSQ